MEIFNFDFHIAHMVIAIIILSLSESLLKSSSKVSAADPPLIRPRVMVGQSLPVDLCHIIFDVSHARACPLLAHSIHMCCSVSVISITTGGGDYSRGK